MNNRINDILDRELRKERASWYFGIAMLLLIPACILVALYPIYSTNHEGRAINYSTVQTDYGTKPVMWVKLDDGGTARVPLPVNSMIKHDSRVEIVETTTLIGLHKFKFVRYVE